MVPPAVRCALPPHSFRRLACGRAGHSGGLGRTAEIGALVFFFFVSVAGAGLINNLIKFLVGRSRPLRFDQDGTLTFTPFAFDAIHYSFTSGHATNITAVVVALLLIIRPSRPLVVALIAAAALIWLSRVVVRAHFPSDVIGGIAVGAGFTLVFANWLARRGMAFRVSADFRLVPRTIAIRKIIRQGGWRALANGLASALRG
jgi:membrane-associated phospholipid phosphatase